MASSEVQVASSSSPFGCVLKDHNLRDRRPPTANPAASKCQPNLQKTLKELVRDHLRCNENSNSNQPPSNCSSRPTYPPRRWQIKRQDPSKPANFSRDPSPALSDSSISGLVQKWRGLETSEDPKQSDDRIQSPVLNSDNDSTSDWESDQVADKEKLRVVDIIRRLPLADGMPECGEGAALFSPRIRGRQAVADLFARMARDRYHEVESLTELHTVSKFPKRGRIQSLLKMKLLTREASAYNHRQYQEPRVYESSKSTRQRIASVKSLRRRFSTGAAQQNDSGNNVVAEKAPSDVTEANNDEKASASNPPMDIAEEINDEASEPKHQEEECVEQLGMTETKEGENHPNEEEGGNLEAESSSAESTEVVLQDTTLQPETEDLAQEIIPSSDLVWRENGSDEWEEDDDEEGYYDDGFFESNPDWIHDISRPRSYWERRRRSRYEEILESSPSNEIRQLIERGSVSAVLTSDFRDRMDQLMISSVQLQMHPRSCEDEDQENRPIVTSDFRDRMDKLMMSRVQLQMDPISREDEDRLPVMDVLQSQKELSGDSEEQNQDHEHLPVEEANEDIIDEEDDEQSLSYYREQTPALELPWSSYQDEEDSDDFEPATHHQDSDDFGPSIKNGSITEMELIYDIRAHMQQMYREMSELRRAVSSCVDIQSKLQSSIREEVSAAINHLMSERTEGNESRRKARKGSCCICREKKADSVLYRCGHMCTCFECGSELQWNSGKCPICWAQIADVVRVVTDYC